MNFSQICRILAVFAIFPLFTFSQRGKNSDYAPLSGTNNIVVNAYTTLSANASGTNVITVANNSLTNSILTTPLAAGDLILIIQMQGATMDIDPTVSTDPSWGPSNYTTPYNHTWDGQWPNYINEWGQVLSPPTGYSGYNNAGKFEQAEVRSVSGTTSITLQCNLVNSYDISGKVQVIRVPRFNNLTLATNTSIVPTAWNGTTGGVVAVEVNGTLTINGTGKISATALGFRGGVVQTSTSVQSGVVAPSANNTNPVSNGTSFLGSYQLNQGARKGEGIGGYTTEYAAKYSEFGRGAPANGGGGGGIKNAGGGGGANVGAGTYTGKGVPNPAYASSWLQETGMGAASSGGGRGGYSYSDSDQNATALGPNQNAWGGDRRKSNGGLGGHPLLYDATRLFMGGGGGAGESDNAGQGGAGGAGGGIVFITAYGTITGNGSIESDGAVGQKTNPTNQPAGALTKRGNDGAGGAGAGGSIYIKNTSAIPSSITINARGGAGGNHDLTYGTPAPVLEATGPGGGGGGGNIAFTSGTPVQTVTGGLSGTSNSPHVTEFPPNGATGGAAGVASLPTTSYNIIPNNITVCAGSPITLTVSTTGTLPGTLSWYTTQFGATPIAGATSTSYTPSPAPTSTTTYYVGVCPGGTFRVPVTVTITPNPIISGTPVITNAGCTVPGSITGLSASGGTGTLDYTWNGISSVNANLSNVGPGAYTLVVTDDNGCTAQSGPHTITGTSGPIFNTTNMVVTNEICNGTLGSITGITATGTSLTYNWSPSGGTALNASNLTAGSYTITATDNVGCTASAGPFNVAFVPGPTVNTTALVTTDETCSLNNGSIIGITASGTGLSYSWSNGGGSSLNASNLNAGSYTLTVTDVNGCTATAGPYSLVDQTAPVINASGVVVTNENCGQGNGAISGISVSGGAPSLSYAWTNSSQTTLNISSLSAGSYTLTVTDQNGCNVQSGPYTVLNTGGPVFDATNVVVSDVSCLGTMGSITGITASGIGLEYLWLPSGGTSLDATGLTAGNYTIAATDDNGCIAYSGPYAVGTIVGPSVDATALVETDESCTASNGSLTGITASGNALTYSWSNAGGSSLDATNLPAGTYTLTVTDGIGCTASAGPFTLIDNSGPIINVSNLITADEHCSQGDGLIIGIDVTGGNPALSYSWDNSVETTVDLFDISAGTYNLTVIDQLGCVAVAGPFIINNIAGPIIDETNLQVENVLCDGTLGSITGLNATGQSSLTYAWTNSGGNNIDATDLAAGVYILTVTDNFGCTDQSGPYTIDAPVQIIINESAMIVTESSCTVNNGTISGITFTGGNGPTVSWSNGADVLDINNLGPGSYTLTISDAQGCSDQLVVDVVTLNGPIIDNTNLSISAAHCGQWNGSISGLTVTGGTPAYFYEWNGNSTLNTLDISAVASGSYTLVVTDAAGCTDTETVTIGEIGGPTVDATNINVVQPGCLTGGQISGLSASGEAPLTYSWTNSVSAALDQNNLNAGSYTLTVTDNYGCTAEYGPVVMNEPNVPNADFTWTPASPDVNVEVNFDNISTGNGPLTSVWSINGETFNTENADYTFTQEGSYPVTLVITDANGCVDQVTYDVQIFGQLIIPNVVTANGDGVNDLFIVEGLKPNTSLTIVNRWGNVVLQTDNYQNDWNGDDLNGFRLLDGVYTYILTPENDQPKHGFVHLVR